VCKDGPCCCDEPPENCTLTVTVTGGSGSGEYEWDFATESWVGDAPLGEVSFNAATCEITYSESDTPGDEECYSWSAVATALIACEECCENGIGLGCSLSEPTFTLTEYPDCTGVAPTNITLTLTCEGESCCAGSCESAEDCDTECACVEGECVAAGSCCFKNIINTYSFTFLGYSGTTSGSWFGTGTEYLQYFCTTGVVVCGVLVGDGVFFRFFDGTDNWEGWDQGNAITYPCASRTSLAGSYTLTNCTTSATSTLTIT
jgi:hypothetical protein